MKNMEDLEKKFKTKADILLVLDYNGVVASTEPKLSSPFSSNTFFKRILENLARQEYIKIAIITNREIEEFRKEFEINLEEIVVYGCEKGKSGKSKGKFYNEEGKIFDKEVEIIGEIFTRNPGFGVVYAGDDKQLIAKVKEMNGNAIGIPPLCKVGEKLVDFSVSQNNFEDFLVTVHNLYL